MLVFMLEAIIGAAAYLYETAVRWLCVFCALLLIQNAKQNCNITRHFTVLICVHEMQFVFFLNDVMKMHLLRLQPLAYWQEYRGQLPAFPNFGLLKIFQKIYLGLYLLIFRMLRAKFENLSTLKYLCQKSLAVCQKNCKFLWCLFFFVFWPMIQLSAVHASGARFISASEIFVLLQPFVKLSRLVCFRNSGQSLCITGYWSDGCG